MNILITGSAFGIGLQQFLLRKLLGFSNVVLESR